MFQSQYCTEIEMSLKYCLFLLNQITFPLFAMLLIHIPLFNVLTSFFYIGRVNANFDVWIVDLACKSPTCNSKVKGRYNLESLFFISDTHFCLKCYFHWFLQGIHICYAHTYLEHCSFSN